MNKRKVQKGEEIEVLCIAWGMSAFLSRPNKALLITLFSLLLTDLYKY